MASEHRYINGTPIAFIYAILFFDYYEYTKILREFRKNLLFYKQQIDDVLGILINNPDNPFAWEDFQDSINKACKLNWTLVQPTHKVDFINLTISIDQFSNISTKTQGR